LAVLAAADDAMPGWGRLREGLIMGMACTPLRLASLGTGVTSDRSIKARIPALSCRTPDAAGRDHRKSEALLPLLDD
jgi:hypothetical protein